MSSPLFILYLWRVLFRQKFLIQIWPECLRSQNSSALLAHYFLHVYLDNETTRLMKDFKHLYPNFWKHFLVCRSCFRIWKISDSYHYKINCFIKNKGGPDCLSLDSLFVRLVANWGNAHAYVCNTAYIQLRKRLLFLLLAVLHVGRKQFYWNKVINVLHLP